MEYSCSHFAFDQYNPYPRQPSVCSSERAFGMKDSQGVRLWFVASLIYALVCTSLGLRQAFAAEYVVQDDARQHVTWLLRLTDPGLFPRDLIADYFLSLLPAGYRGLYRFFGALGIDSLLASKIIPAFLAVTSAAYCFGFCRRIAQLPSAAFFSTVILTQCLWMNKDVA